MKNKKLVLIIITIFTISLFIIGSTYAFWSWNSSSTKNVVFNTAGSLKNYIIYDEGESKFSGNFEATSNYTNGMHSTISIYKTSEAANVDLLATINMTINTIGNTMKESPALKWKVTEGNSTNIGATLAEGNFLGFNNGDELKIVSDIEVTTDETFYTIWIWLDSSEFPNSSLTGETLDIDVWTQVDQLSDVEDILLITQAYAKYQVINATARDNKHQITNYAVTTSNIEPSTWTNIPSNEQGNVYRLTYAVPTTGAYYIWFKDNANKVVSKPINVTELDTTAPTFNIEASLSNSVINATLKDIVETGSGLSGTYYWKVSTSSVCDNTTSDFVSTSSNFYEFTISTNETYYVCAKVGDNVGNYGYNSVIPISKVYTYLGNTTQYFKATAYKDKITSVSFVNEINIPENATNWNVGTSPSNASDVKAWLEDDTNNIGKFSLKVGANGTIFANNLSYAFYSLSNVSNFNFSSLNTSETTTMLSMFSNTGQNATDFNLNLGNQFNTINVTNMAGMFSQTGRNSTNFSLNLGSKFNTSNVTTMSNMFSNTGQNATNFSLNLGNQFNTSNVTNMYYMFSNAGSNATNFNLDLGSEFNTINVTNMAYMFSNTGFKATNFSLNLGNNFNTSNITSMAGMFSNTGQNATNFSLNFGSEFNTSNVTIMTSMFYYAGRNATNFSLNLGNQFNTSNVTSMAGMFLNTGLNATNFSLNLGNHFNTSNVTSMASMFSNTGRNATNFSLELGNHFNTSKVTNMANMFYYAGYNATNFSLNLGSEFNTSKVTNMANMFSYAGYNATNFSLNLDNQFNTSKVTNMANMFYYAGRNATNFSLDLGNEFNTINVTTMASMFYYAGYNATNFSLDLGNHFNMSNVTNIYRMFYYTGNKTQTSFNLDLAAGNFNAVTNNTNMFYNFPTSYATIYVKDTDAQSFIISQNSGFSASNVLIK